MKNPYEHPPALINTMTPAAGDLLTTGQCNDILYNYLQWGGLALVPSDCGYALCGMPNNPRAMRMLDLLLDHADTPIPLSVGSAHMASTLLALHPIHLRLAAELWPGQLTLVAPASRLARRLTQHLHVNGSLGVRVSTSNIERQLSAEAGTALTTAAVRADGGALVTAYEDAWDLIFGRLTRSKLAGVPIVGVRRQRPFPFDVHSTVVDVSSTGAPRILREGAVPSGVIRALSVKVARAEYGDAT